MSFKYQKTKSLDDISNIIRKINKDIINKYPDINKGGCGAYSLYMHNILTLFGFDVKICMLSHEKNVHNIIIPDVYDFKTFLNLPFGHIILNIDNIYFDSKIWTTSPHTISVGFPYLIPGYLERSVLKDMVDDRRLWNNDFNYDYFIEVKQLIVNRLNELYWNLESISY